jgi:hypothetical protein
MKLNRTKNQTARAKLHVSLSKLMIHTVLQGIKGNPEMLQKSLELTETFGEFGHYMKLSQAKNQTAIAKLSLSKFMIHRVL